MSGRRRLRAVVPSSCRLLQLVENDGISATPGSFIFVANVAGVRNSVSNTKV